MRVGFFTYGIHGERMTGIARYTVELTRALKALQGVEIVLLNPYPNADHPWYGEFETCPLPGLKLLPFAATKGNWQLHRAARRLGLDILHDPCGIAPFLAQGGTYKRVTTVHDAIPLIYPKTQPLLTRLVFHTLIRATGRTADAVVTVSRASADDLHQHLGIPRAKLHVTPLGVEPSAGLEPSLSEPPPTEPPYFLYVGALHPRKNLPRVLEAFAQLRAEHDVRLVIVGPASWGADRVLQAVLERSRADEAVSFSGFVSDDELGRLYSNATGLVFPSLYEGFGLPVLEAMSRGTPVITSDVSSLPEVAGDAALYVTPTSVDAITEAMRSLVQTPSLRLELKRKGLVQAQRFSWQATAAQTLNLYNDLLA